jgi:hypothetical protein
MLNYAVFALLAFGTAASGNPYNNKGPQEEKVES